MGAKRGASANRRIGGSIAAHSRQLTARLVGTFFALILRLIDLSWRKDPEVQRQLDRLIATGRPLLAVFWHGKYLPLFTAMGGRQASGFVSSSLRGMIVAEICRHFGYDPVLIPDRGGERSRQLVRQALSQRQIGGFAVDGPVGPYHIVKPGLIEIAGERGGFLVPITVAAGRKLVLAGRWDRMEIPLPFSSLTLIIGEPIEVPRGISGDRLTQLRLEVRRVLEALDAKAEAMATDPSSAIQAAPNPVDPA